MTNVLNEVRAAHERLRKWACEYALPVWYTHGRRDDGGFHEVLDFDLSAPEVPRRSRVVGRQIYSFAVAPRLGWDGNWFEALNAGLEAQCRDLLLPSGTLRDVLNFDGSSKSDAFVLYNQAFGIFGWAAVADTATRLDRPELRKKAETLALGLRDVLMTEYAHPGGGFWEDLDHALPLEANPHMHLLEASLAWEEIGGDVAWSALADEIVELALTQFISPEGWLREHFTADWIPVKGLDGRRCEPGHHMEWAWLLVRWGLLRNRPDALECATNIAHQAEQHGVDPARGMMLMEVLDDGTWHDDTARMWSQTERLKGHAALASVAKDSQTKEQHLRFVLDAIHAIERFSDVTPKGLWHDKMLPDGSFEKGPAPASTFYHILCAIDVLGVLLEEEDADIKKEICAEVGDA